MFKHHISVIFFLIFINNSVFNSFIMGMDSNNQPSNNTLNVSPLFIDDTITHIFKYVGELSNFALAYTCKYLFRKWIEYRNSLIKEIKNNSNFIDIGNKSLYLPSIIVCHNGQNADILVKRTRTQKNPHIDFYKWKTCDISVLYNAIENLKYPNFTDTNHLIANDHNNNYLTYFTQAATRYVCSSTGIHNPFIGHGDANNRYFVFFANTHMESFCPALFISCNGRRGRLFDIPYHQKISTIASPYQFTCIFEHKPDSSYHNVISYCNSATINFNQDSYDYIVTTLEEYFRNENFNKKYDTSLLRHFSYKNFDCLPKFKNDCIFTDSIKTSVLPFGGIKKEIQRAYTLKTESLWHNKDALHAIYLLINKHIAIFHKVNWAAFKYQSHQYETKLVELYTAGVLGGWDEEDTKQYLSNHMDTLLTPLYESIIGPLHGKGDGGNFCSRNHTLIAPQKKEKIITGDDIHTALTGMLQHVTSFEEAMQKVTWFTNLTAKIIFESWLEKYEKDTYDKAMATCTLL